MTNEDRYRISVYKDVSVVSENPNKKIHLVKDEATDTLYIKKTLTDIRNYDLYNRLTLLQHRNLAKVHHAFKSSDEICIIEDYVNGQTLKTIIEQQGALAEDAAVEYICQVCDGLAYLHGQIPPIIHRDIKPDNIICATDGTIKIIDFDIAREHKQSASRDTVFMGTKEYAAPEQYGYKQTDCRADIYSVGVLLHELITGRLPENNIVYNGRLRKVIDRCLQLDPDGRYQSISALKKDLTARELSLRKIAALVAVFIIAAAVSVIIFINRATQDELPSDTEIVFLEDAGADENITDETASDPTPDNNEVVHDSEVDIQNDIEEQPPITDEMDEPATADNEDLQDSDIISDDDTGNAEADPPIIADVEPAPTHDPVPTQDPTPARSGIALLDEVEFRDGVPDFAALTGGGVFVNANGDSSIDRLPLIFTYRAVHDTLRSILGSHFERFMEFALNYGMYEEIRGFYRSGEGTAFLLSNRPHTEDWAHLSVNHTNVTASFRSAAAGRIYFFTTASGMSGLHGADLRLLNRFPNSIVIFYSDPVLSAESIIGVYESADGGNRIEVFADSEGALRISVFVIRRDETHMRVDSEPLHRLYGNNFQFHDLESPHADRTVIATFTDGHLLITRDSPHFTGGIYTKAH